VQQAARAVVTTLAGLALVAMIAMPARAAPSPTVPNPHPPLGGTAPDGTVPGGEQLKSRGLIRPVGAAALPAKLTAQSWILFDLGTGAVLAAKDPHGEYQPASILKTLTALTLLPRPPRALQ
jgi:D-alanyl-D-alanine carboxypeptidase (penicillin-binding protein 5/6)